MPTVSEATKNVMRANRSHGTKPELLALELFAPLGVDYTSDRPEVLYGRPDMIHMNGQVAIFVHGCYWHQCKVHWKCPKTNAEFWLAKMRRNKARHAHVSRVLREWGWSVMTMWEHDLRSEAGRSRVLGRLERMIDGNL